MWWNEGSLSHLQLFLKAPPHSENCLRALSQMNVKKNQIPETLLCFVCPLHRSPPSASSLFIFPKGPVTGDIQMCLFHLLTFRDGLVVGVFSVLLRSLTPVAIQRGGRRSLTQHLLPLLLLLAVFISLLIRVTLCSFRRSKHTHAF